MLSPDGFEFQNERFPCTVWTHWSLFLLFVQVPRTWACVSERGADSLLMWQSCSLPDDCLALFFAGLSSGLEAEECGRLPEEKGRGGEGAVCLSGIDWRKAGSLFPVQRCGKRKRRGRRAFVEGYFHAFW